MKTKTATLTCVYPHHLHGAAVMRAQWRNTTISEIVCTTQAEQVIAVAQLRRAARAAGCTHVRTVTGKESVDI